MSFATEEVGKTCDTFIKTANGLLGKRVANFSPWPSFFLFLVHANFDESDDIANRKITSGILMALSRFMLTAVLHSRNEIFSVSYPLHKRGWYKLALADNWKIQILGGTYVINI